MRDDAALLREFVTQRSESAFAELVHRHIDAVYSAALRRVGGDTHLAQDVTQYVFTALATKATALTRHPFLTAWLYTATRHQAANTVRAERRRRAREQEAMEIHESSSATSAEPDWHRIAPVLDQAIDQLGESDRTALLLRFIERRPFGDIGARLQLSEDAARMRVDRALDKLRRALARRGITSTAAALGLALTHEAVAAAPAALATSVSSAALGAAAVSGSSVLALLSTMTSTKAFAFAAGAVLLGCLTLTVEQFRAARAAAAQLRQVTAEQQALTAKLAAVQAPIGRGPIAQTTTSQKTSARTNNDSVRIATASSRQTTVAKSSWDPSAEGDAFMQRHPEVRAALLAWKDAQTNFQWSDFYFTAGLTAAEIAEFQRLHREGGGLTRPLRQGGQEIFLSPGSGLTQSEVDQRLRTLLGPERYRLYREADQNRAVREFTGRLAATLAFSSEPLLAGQIEPFIQQLNARGAVSFGRTGPEHRWDDILAAARTQLSAVQVAALERVRLQADFNTAWSRAAAAIYAQANANSTSTPATP